jgi:hypothetical protein
MKTPVPVFVIALTAAVAVAGCSKQPDADSALEAAVQAMEQPEAGQPVAAPVPQPTSPSHAAAPTQPTPAIATTAVAQQMNQAVTAYQGGHYVDAVTRLQQLRAMTGKTPEQTMALQEAIAAVMGELYTRASKGDARAKAAVKEYERIQNARQ